MGAPEELLRSGFHRLEVSQVELEVDPFFSSFSLEVFDGLLRLLLTSRGEVDLGVVCKEGLGNYRRYWRTKQRER